MKELINVNYDTQTVSARELHEKLGATERFSSWFERYAQYGFVENEDYFGCKEFNTLARQELQNYNIQSKWQSNYACCKNLKKDHGLGNILLI